MKYFLVEVKKAFGIYPLKAQMVMREKLVKWIFAKKIKVIRELKESELKKEFATNVKYTLEETKREKTKNLGTVENIETKDVVTDVVDTNTTEDTITDAKDENTATDEVITDNVDEAVVENDVVTEKVEETVETDEVIVPVEDNEDFEDKTTEELLKICNETYKMNKPVNTGRPNLLASLKEITK